MIDWTTVLISTLGSLIGSTIVLFGVRYQLNKDKNKDNLREYNHLIMILYELKRNIHRAYWNLVQQQKGVISFGILSCPAFKKGFEIGVSDLDISIYERIHKIYAMLEIYSDNFNRANLNKTYQIKTNVLVNERLERIEENVSKNLQGFTKKNIPVYIQKDIITDRYHNGLAFVREYLLDFYKLFNEVLVKTKKYAIKNKFEFPHDLDGYSKDFVSKISQDLNLTYKMIK